MNRHLRARRNEAAHRASTPKPTYLIPTWVLLLIAGVAFAVLLQMPPETP